MTWSFSIKEKNAKHEGYDKAFIKGNIQYAADYPGCPYCGKTGFTLCGTCGHLGCTITKNGIYTCEWCGTQGTLGNYTGDAIASGSDL
ncbi:TerY-C metal binding domain-containing protein [Syntrophaceticus schinkii]|uniref:TerY-C metal binding domain-containing protein n=1 Tax=Syntrophaceticus schinkii TaxID=499207 RepID=UPI0012EC78B6